MCIRDSSSLNRKVQNNELNIPNGNTPVSYTHLDVYKRQINGCFSPSFQLNNENEICTYADKVDIVNGGRTEFYLLKTVHFLSPLSIYLLVHIFL